MGSEKSENSFIENLSNEIDNRNESHKIVINDGSYASPEKKIDLCAISTNGRHIATYSSDQGKVQLWELYEGNYIRSTKEYTLKPRVYLHVRQSFVSYFPSNKKMPNVDFVLNDNGRYHQS